MNTGRELTGEYPLAFFAFRGESQSQALKRAAKFLKQVEAEAAISHEPVRVVSCTFDIIDDGPDFWYEFYVVLSGVEPYSYGTDLQAMER